MTGTAQLPFLHVRPPLAARIRSLSDAGQRRNFVLYKDSSVEEIGAGDVDGSCVGEVVLLSGALLRGKINDREPAAFFAELMEKFVEGRGSEALYGVTPALDKRCVDSVYVPAGASPVSASMLWLDEKPLGLRVRGTGAKIRVLFEEQEKYASAIVVPMLSAPQGEAEIDVVPVLRDGGAIGLDVIHPPSLAASFFRYLESDAIDAAGIVGMQIVSWINRPFKKEAPQASGVTGGDLLAAAVFALRFARTEEIRAISQCISRFSSTPAYAAFRSDLGLATLLLQFAGEGTVEDFGNRVLAFVKADDLPSSTWLIVYANRYLTDFAIDRNEQELWRDQIMGLSRWTGRLELRRPFPLYSHGAADGPDKEPSQDLNERRVALEAAKKKSSAG